MNLKKFNGLFGFESVFVRFLKLFCTLGLFSSMLDLL